MKSFIQVLVLALVIGWAEVICGAPAGGRIVQTWMTNSQVGLRFETTSGCSYQVQSGRSRFWRDALPSVTASENLTSVVVAAPGGDDFFRVLEFTNRVFWYDWTYYYENAHLGNWGLGSKQSGYAHADRPYDWYIDQADTGSCSNNNCGPAAVTMAIKWRNPGFTRTAEDARNTYFRGGGWWYTSDIINYLNLNTVPNTVTLFPGTNVLMALLSQGNIAIVCLNTTYLSQNPVGEHRVGRSYNYAGGHFLVIKGWRAVGSAVFFEVYDSNNWHASYVDGTPKGRNRHLPSADLTNAIAKWWNYLIVIPPAASAPRMIAHAGLTPVDPNSIVHAAGR